MSLKNGILDGSGLDFGTPRLDSPGQILKSPGQILESQEAILDIARTHLGILRFVVVVGGVVADVAPGCLRTVPPIVFSAPINGFKDSHLCSGTVC